MKKIAVDQAHQRLQTMRKAYAEYQNLENIADMKESWIKFLTAMSTVYSKLEQGCKVSEKSKNWFHKQKGIRRTDNLLNYLHRARNSSEHGIEEISLAGYSVEATVGDAENFEIGIGFSNDGRLFPHVKSAVSGSIKSFPFLHLIRVNDSRFGDFCDPASKHKDQKIDGTKVECIAPLAIIYIESMIDEAHSLISLEP